MLKAIADTHTIIWYLYADSRLSESARLFIESAAADGDQIAISAISLAENVYLSEKGRIIPDALSQLLQALDSPHALFLEIPFDRRVAQNLAGVERSKIPELPDRIIAATGQFLNLPIISRDHKIHLSGLDSIW